MNAKDLRIGNWILFDGRPVKVFDLPYLVDDDKEGYLINQSWADEYEPIPLTPEILEQCEFMKDNSGHFWHKTGILIMVDDRNEGYKYNVIVKEKQLQSLHQLQNLYFALTGEELTIQL